MRGETQGACLSGADSDTDPHPSSRTVILNFGAFPMSSRCVKHEVNAFPFFCKRKRSELLLDVVITSFCLFSFILFYASECFACRYVWKPEKGDRCPASGDTDSCEPPYGCCKLNPGPSGEQPMLLTAEPPLQPLGFWFLRQGSTKHSWMPYICVDHDGLKLTEICLLCLSSAGFKGIWQHAQPLTNFVKSLTI